MIIHQQTPVILYVWFKGTSPLRFTFQVELKITALFRYITHVPSEKKHLLENVSQSYRKS